MGFNDLPWTKTETEESPPLLRSSHYRGTCTLVIESLVGWIGRMVVTTDLEKLSSALQRDTSDKLLEEAVENHKEQIQEALKAGRDYILEGPPRLVIKKAS
jgi:hypothetical protein